MHLLFFKEVMFSPDKGKSQIALRNEFEKYEVPDEPPISAEFADMLKRCL